MFLLHDLVSSVGKEGINPALNGMMGRDSLHPASPCPYLIPQVEEVNMSCEETDTSEMDKNPIQLTLIFKERCRN